MPKYKVRILAPASKDIYRVVYGASDYPKSSRSDTAYLYGSALNRDEIKSQGMEINPLILTSTQIVHTLGTDFLGRTLIVIYTHRKNDIRLISARAATNAERKEYEQRRI